MHYRVELLHSLIDFYGHSGDIDNALNIFNGINNARKNTVSLNVILKALVNNNLNKKALLFHKQYSYLLCNKSDDTIAHLTAIKA